MITAIDTNILIDVFCRGQLFAEVSAGALRHSMANGVLSVCEVVWAECIPAFGTEKRLNDTMRSLGIRYVPMSEEAASRAGDAWREYKLRDGKRTRVISDFMIGAHAEIQCDCLITRDRGFFKTYFPKLRIIDPSKK